MKRVTAIQLVERGKRLKKWFAAGIAVSITLAMLVMAVD
jgi:hypothetical protein